VTALLSTVTDVRVLNDVTIAVWCVTVDKTHKRSAIMIVDFLCGCCIHRLPQAQGPTQDSVVVPADVALHGQAAEDMDAGTTMNAVVIPQEDPDIVALQGQAAEDMDAGTTMDVVVIPQEDPDVAALHGQAAAEDMDADTAMDVVVIPQEDPDVAALHGQAAEDMDADTTMDVVFIPQEDPDVLRYVNNAEM
jgi:hypothetical protein